MEFRGSRTEANLMAAYAGESQARVKYLIYQDKAKKEGYEQIGDLFGETSHNEQAHATIWFKYLHDNGVPATLDALKDAAGGEHFEWTEMYREYADIAKQEGFTEIAAKMELVLKIEKEHEDRFRKLIQNIEQGEVFKKPNAVVWRCQNCGHLHFGPQAPGVCPACGYPQSYFEIKTDNY